MKIKKIGNSGRIFILDGYNVIHAIPELKQILKKNLQAGREALISLSAEYLRQRGDVAKVIVVFDGQSREIDWMQEKSSRGVEIIYSDSGQRADERILEILESHSSRSAIVVSNDRFVINHGRALGAHVIPAVDFYAAAQAPHEKSRKKHSFEDSPAAKKITEDYKRHLGIE